MLWDCDVGALGLAYLVLLVLAFAVQPRRGRWAEFAASGRRIQLDASVLPRVMRGMLRALGPHHSVSLLDSPALRWAPQLLLAALAAADFAAQAALPAVAAADWPVHIPAGVLDFLQQVVGELLLIWRMLWRRRRCAYAVLTASDVRWLESNPLLLPRHRLPGPGGGAQPPPAPPRGAAVRRRPVPLSVLPGHAAPPAAARRARALRLWPQAVRCCSAVVPRGSSCTAAGVHACA